MPEPESTYDDRCVEPVRCVRTRRNRVLLAQCFPDDATRDRWDADLSMAEARALYLALGLVLEGDRL